MKNLTSQDIYRLKEGDIINIYYLDDKEFDLEYCSRFERNILFDGEFIDYDKNITSKDELAKWIDNKMVVVALDNSTLESRLLEYIDLELSKIGCNNAKEPYEAGLYDGAYCTYVRIKRMIERNYIR